jgi:hypothetical protein
MPIPGSGPISMSMLNVEVGKALNAANTLLAGGSVPTVGSLFYLGGQSGSLNQTAPHNISEWYGYTAGTTTTTTVAPATTTTTVPPTTTTTTVPPTTTTTSTTTTTTTAGGLSRTFVFSPYTSSRSTTTSVTPIAINVTEPFIDDGPPGAVAFMMATGDINSVAFDVNLGLRSGSTTISTIQYNVEPQDVLDRISLGGSYPFLNAATSQPYTSSFFPETSSLDSGYAGYALTILQLALFSNETASYSAGSTRYRDPGYATKTSITLPNAGTYVIIGSSGMNPADTTINANVRIFDGTNEFGVVNDVYAQDAATWSPYWHVFVRTIASSTTFSLQARSNNGDDLFLRQSSLVALDTSEFPNVYYAQRTGSFSTTSTTYVNAFTGSFNIANINNYHILLASAMLSGSSNTAQFATKLRNTSTSVDYTPEHIREPNATSEEFPTVVARVVDFTQTSNTIAWQLDVVTSGTAHLSDMTIVVLDTGIAIGTDPYNPTP